MGITAQHARGGLRASGLSAPQRHVYFGTGAWLAVAPCGRTQLRVAGHAVRAAQTLSVRLLIRAWSVGHRGQVRSLQALTGAQYGGAGSNCGAKGSCDTPSISRASLVFLPFKERGTTWS